MNQITVDKLIGAQAPANLRLASNPFALYSIHSPHQLFLIVSQLHVVRSEHVRTLFDSSQFQEF